jgi:hypothetical protein
MNEHEGCSLEIKSLEERIKNAMDVINSYGYIDGAHHKQWIIDQIARSLLGPCDYEAWAAEEEWDVGIAP